MINKEFMGLNGFIWFMGVVEDRNDPYMAGRVKVRCFGHHTGNKTDLPTEDLPWAQVMLPVTSSGISGIGQTPLGLVEGSHVFGFFRDGENRQELVVMGSLPGAPKELGDPNKGFYSPKKGEDIALPYYKNRDMLKGYSNYPRWKDSPDTNQLATAPENYSFYASPYHDLTYHYMEKAIEADVVGIKPVAIFAQEQMQLASAFISKGTSSLFGFVSDIITGLALDVIGNQIITGSKVLYNSLGITQLVKDTVPSLVSGGEEVLKKLGQGTDWIIGSTLYLAKGADGYLKTTLSWDAVKFGDFTPTQSSLRAIGGELTKTAKGYYRLAITNPNTMREMFGTEAVANNEDIHLFQKAEAQVASGQTLTVDQSVLANRTVTGLESTKVSQAESLTGATQKVDAVASSGEGILTTYNDQGVLVAVAGGIGTDSITQQGRILGSQGKILKTRNINAKSYAGDNTAGRIKLMARTNSIDEEQGTWKVPELPKNPSPYPHKHVHETESGHLTIYDDNLNYESIEQIHSSGTRYQVAYDGSKVDRVVSDHITAVQGTTYKIVEEDENVTVEGHYKITVNKSGEKGNNYEIAIGKNANVQIMVEKGDFNVNVLDGRINMNCSDNFNVLCGGEMNVIAQGDMSFNSGDDITLRGDKIFLN